MDLAAAAEAAARRLQSPPGKAPNPKEQYAAEREKRQHFRRLIDPGIVRPNSKEVTSLVLQVRTVRLNVLTMIRLSHNHTAVDAGQTCREFAERTRQPQVSVLQTNE